MLDLLFENLINGVATILKHIDQIHNFLLSELQVFDLIFKNATLCLRLTLGFNRVVNLLKSLLILTLCPLNASSLFVDFTAHNFHLGLHFIILALIKF